MSNNIIYNTLKNDIILLDDISEHHIKNVAFLSLKISLISYFRTAKALNYYYNGITCDPNLSQQDKDRYHGIIYANEAYNAVFHFQNFLELVIKEICNSLTGNTNANHLNLPHNLSTIVAGIDSGRFDRRYVFIKNYENAIIAINKLRNDSVHEGAYILRINSLDELFGKYALPLMKEVHALPEYQANLYWTYNLDNNEISPIDDIIVEYKNNAPNPYKIQLLKLIANAAYENEIMISHEELDKSKEDILQSGKASLFGLLYGKKVEKAEKEAINLAHINNKDVEVCPVCHQKTLVLEQDWYDNGLDETDPEYQCGYYTYKVFCTQCGLEIPNYLISKLPTLGLRIKDYSKM